MSFAVYVKFKSLWDLDNIKIVHGGFGKNVIVHGGFVCFSVIFIVYKTCFIIIICV